ncbi:methyltransferase [Lithospermum erythrorhizon]|uniref:Methyltransferase n=1 Tax=Lithospermum erythrorhizon TaxID=34254 RepID=A0AAV3RCX6_LITER
MEKKKLYFERPLLPARRFTSGAAPETGSKWKSKDSGRSVRRPPPYKSELKSGLVSNPRTVPFDWEQIPGRPKDDETIHKDKKRNVSDGSWNVQSSDENVEQSRSFRDGKEGLDNCSSGNEGGEFVDALETLSRTESLLINCSFSDLIGWEDQGAEASGNPPIDSQTCEIMMGRFLPAAKAMAAETPQYGPRNPPVIHQRFRQQHKMLNADTRSQLHYGPDFVVECLQRDEDGIENSACDYYEERNFHGKSAVYCLVLACKARFVF